MLGSAVRMMLAVILGVAIYSILDVFMVAANPKPDFLSPVLPAVPDLYENRTREDASSEQGPVSNDVQADRFVPYLNDLEARSGEIVTCL